MLFSKSMWALVVMLAALNISTVAVAQIQVTQSASEYLISEQLHDLFAGNRATGIAGGDDWYECYQEDGDFKGTFEGYSTRGTWTVKRDELGAYVHYVYRGGQSAKSRIKVNSNGDVEYYKLSGEMKGKARLSDCD